MTNPNPITRARRMEMRRKQVGYADRCFYCGETDFFCFELDHPVTQKLDSKFTRTVCRNCHRKLEVKRDLKGLTKNGLHAAPETENEQLRRYLLLLAEDQESIAGACNHPNVPSIHFCFTIQPNHIRPHKMGPNGSNR